MNAVFEAFAPVDAAVATAVEMAGTPALIEFMTALSAAHTLRGISVILAGACAWLLALRDRRGALWLPLTVYSGAVLNHLLKHGIQRPRPGQDALAVTDFAFPSGHAAESTLLYGALAALVFLHSGSRGLRAAALAGAMLMVVLVGASRLVLRAHWFSDVIGGVLVGGVWLALCLAACAAWRRRSARRPDDQQRRAQLAQRQRGQRRGGQHDEVG